MLIKFRRTGYATLGMMCLVVIDPVSAQTVGQVLPPWSAGYLDIHFINTGRGECSFLMLPDGTTLLVDAGDSKRSNRRITEPRPDASRTPGAWIGRYVIRMLAASDKEVIDYAILSHFHTDHMGIVAEDAGPPAGAYHLSGITEVADYAPYRKMIDRAWPEYDDLVTLNSRTMINYRKFLKVQIEKHALQVERFRPGANDQITLCYAPDSYRNFAIRNVASNGEVWTGIATNTRHHIPPIKFIPERDRPSENLLSIVFRLSYGSFDYYTGGDLAGIPDPGAPAWHDLETPVARAVGPVDVCELNHHGYWDSQNPFFVESLRPRVYILQARSAGHPSPQTLERLFSDRLYPGPRDIFATNMMEATRIVIGSDTERLKSDQGHIVVRVAPGGAKYMVTILDDAAESFTIRAIHGPYTSR